MGRAETNVISHLNGLFEKNSEPILKEHERNLNNDNNNSEIVNKIIEVLDTKIGQLWQEMEEMVN